MTILLLGGCGAAGPGPASGPGSVRPDRPADVQSNPKPETQADTARELDAPAVGYWQVESVGVQPRAPGRTFSPEHSLWVRPDGSFVRGINPKDDYGHWTVTFGTWEEVDDALILHEQVRVRGWGGLEGFESGDITAEDDPPTCEGQPPSATPITIEGRAACDLLDPFDDFAGMSCRAYDGERLRRVAETVEFAEFDEAFYRNGCAATAR